MIKLVFIFLGVFAALDTELSPMLQKELHALETCTGKLFRGGKPWALEGRKIVNSQPSPLVYVDR